MSSKNKTTEESGNIQSQVREAPGDYSQETRPKERLKLADIFIGIGGSGVKNLHQLKFSVEDAYSIITDVCEKSMTRLYSFVIKETPGLVPVNESPEESLQDLREMIDMEVRRNLASRILTMAEEKENTCDVESETATRRGPSKIKQLLNGFRDSRVCKWFDVVRLRFKNMIDSLNQIMVCFFCALFDVVNIDYSGKAAHFCRVIRSHLQKKSPSSRMVLQEEFPSTRMFQGDVKWFKDWKRGCPQWANPKNEENKHNAWQKLYLLIMGELPKLEPQLAIC